MTRFVFVLAFAPLLSGQTQIASAEAQATAIQKYGELPLSFERRGDSEFVARGEGYTIDLTGAGARLLLHGSSDISMEFVHGRRSAATAENLLPGKVNYIRGNDPRQWKLGIPTYGRVTYHGVYSGVDVVYYGNQQQLEFDVTLQPGADLGPVRMRFKGAEKPRIDSRAGRRRRWF